MGPRCSTRGSAGAAATAVGDGTAGVGDADVAVAANGGGASEPALVGLWEWCRSATPQDLAKLPPEKWGIYSIAHNEDIEAAYLRGEVHVHIIVGVRNYDIVFDGRHFTRFGASAQVDERFRKVRNVRRREVTVAERDARLRGEVSPPGECMFCFSDFSETPFMPVFRSKSCSHVFHLACATPWLDQGRRCPACRRDLDMGDLRSDEQPDDQVRRRARSEEYGNWGVPQRDAVRRAYRSASDVTQQLQPEQAVSSTQWALLIAAQEGRVDDVCNALAAGLNIDTRSPQDATPLISAAQAGHIAVVEQLLSRRANANLMTLAGNTALLLAIDSGQYPIAQALLDARANPLLYNSYGMNALAHARMAATAGDARSRLLLATMLEQQRREDQRNRTPGSAALG
eukprot:NODE_4556_length_1877_cov_4.852571.p2 GENE.NODE_4556_length_1877_cov_4.852571~~NODE_4556_length_1877_cov_4.852571.p2  ORF type:complete len:428 (+),score=103.23 NODE_4556_length_1877_cov_4.852571:85-1284(+)